MSFYKKILRNLSPSAEMRQKLDNIQLALGRIEKRQLESSNYSNPNQWEFQVSSQWGEDGIIQFILSKISVHNKVFVEFGVENYVEANSRFLLQNDNWSGLVIDGSEENIRQITNDKIYWRYNLKVKQAFITKDNIDQLITDSGVTGDIGLLSVDLDGNDYWVWQAIKSIRPCIVISEYNSLFGPTAKVSVPYEPSFIRNTNGKPNTYYGTSIAALTHLASQKGYELVAGNKAGNNAFFVKREFMSNLKAVTPEQAYVKSQFKESRNQDGGLSFKSFDEAVLELGELPVVNVENNKEMLIKEINR